MKRFITGVNQKPGEIPEKPPEIPERPAPDSPPLPVVPETIPPEQPDERPAREVPLLAKSATRTVFRVQPKVSDDFYQGRTQPLSSVIMPPLTTLS